MTRPAKRAAAPSASSIRSASFHFAIRSERANEPTLSRPAFQPTARWTIETSSVSPERAETIVANPASRPASSAASVSVTVPAWFGLMSTALHAPIGGGLADARGVRRQVVVADDLDARARGLREGDPAVAIVLGERILDRRDRVAIEPARAAARSCRRGRARGDRDRADSGRRGRTRTRRRRARSRPRRRGRIRRARSRGPASRALRRCCRTRATTRLRRRRPRACRRRASARRRRDTPRRSSRARARTTSPRLAAPSGPGGRSAVRRGRRRRRSGFPASAATPGPSPAR